LFRKLLFSSGEFWKGGKSKLAFATSGTIFAPLQKIVTRVNPVDSLTINHLNRVISSPRHAVPDASYKLSTTIPPSESQTVMATFGDFDAFSAPPEARGTPQNPIPTQLTASAPKPEDEDEWEYEYSTTEMEVHPTFRYHMDE
jgi:hypothetical protein